MDDDEVQDQQDGQAQDEDVHQLQQLCKDEMAVNHLVKGMCDLWNEERYMLAQAEEDQDVSELAKYANSIHSQLMMLQNQQQQLTKEIDKMVLGERKRFSRPTRWRQKRFVQKQTSGGRPSRRR